jgi:hypothetical protein
MRRARRVGVILTTILVVLGTMVVVELRSRDWIETTGQGLGGPPLRTGTRGGIPSTGATSDRLCAKRSPEKLLALLRLRLVGSDGGEGPLGVASIVGQVVLEEDGQPCSGAVVFLMPHVVEAWGLLRDLLPDTRGLRLEEWSCGPNTRGAREPPRPRLVESGGGGEFAFLALASGRYALVAHAPGYPPSVIPDIEVAGAGEHRLSLRVTRGAVLQGRITDAASGDPVGGARVSVGRTIFLSTVTDPRGNYEIQGVPRLGRSSPLITGGGSPVLVFAAGYPAHEFQTFKHREDTYVGNFTLARGTDIRGRVVDVGGRGVEGARISLSYDTMIGFPDDERPWSCEVVAGSDGAFHIPNLPRGKTYFIWAYEDGFAPAVSPSIGIEPDEGQVRDALLAPEASIVRAGDDVRDVLLTLRPAGGLRIRVTDEGGLPVEGAETAGAERIETAFADLFGPPRREAGRSGLFVAHSLPVGRYDLLVRKRGFVTENVSVCVYAGETTSRDVALRRGATLSGQITDPGGDAVEGCRVVAWPTDDLPVRSAPMVLSCRSDEVGHFELTGLDHGREYTLCATPNWFRGSESESPLGVSAPLRVHAEQRRIVLRVRHTSIVRIRAVDEGTEEPIESVRLILCPRANQAPIAPWIWLMAEDDTTSRDGLITFHGVTPGLYAIETDKGRSTLVSPDKVFVPDNGSPVEIEARMAVRGFHDFSGRVHWNDGTPAAGVCVRVLGDGLLACRRPNITDRRGQFEMLGLAERPRRVVVSGTTPATLWLLCWRKVDTAHDEDSVTIALGRRDGGAICIRTVDETGRSIAGALVTLRSTRGRIIPTGAGLAEKEVRLHRTLLEGLKGAGPASSRFVSLRALAASITGPRGLVFRGSLSPGPLEIEAQATGFRPTRLRVTIRRRTKSYREIALTRL